MTIDIQDALAWAAVTEPEPEPEPEEPNSIYDFAAILAANEPEEE